MKHHAGLEAKDGIILGASNVHHLRENLEDLTKGPLPQSMLDAFEEAWEKVKATSPAYFRTTATRFQIKK